MSRINAVGATATKQTVLNVSVHALLDAASRGIITLTKAETKAFRSMPKTTPVDLKGPMADAMYADAMGKPLPKAVKSLPPKIAAMVEAAEEDDEDEAEVVVSTKAPGKHAARTTRRQATPVKTERDVSAEKAPEARDSKKARAAKKATDNSPKRAAKGEGTSRTPEARRARRILREYLRVSLVATDENEDAEIREAASARAAYLEAKIGELDIA